MDLYFYLLAVFMTLNLGAFLVVAVRYQYKTVEHRRQVRSRRLWSLRLMEAAAVILVTTVPLLGRSAGVLA